MSEKQDSWKSGHRLLVGVGPGRVSQQTVRWARRLADSLNCPWIALYVESPGALARVQQSQVTSNLALARELGAEVLTTADSDVVRGLLRVSFQRNVTQIVLGKPSGGAFWSNFRRDRFLSRLLKESREIDVHIVRTNLETQPETSSLWARYARASAAQYLKAAGLVLLATLVNLLIGPSVGVHATALIYLLAVVVAGVFVERGPTLLAAALSALVWDYIFLPPVFAFRVNNFEDGMLLAMYFIVAIVLGQLTSKNLAQENAERQREQRATALYLLSRELNGATELEEILQKCVAQTERAFRARVGILLPEASHRVNQQFFPPNSLEISESETAATAWVAAHGQAAGKFTDNLSGSEALYLPLTTGSRTIGVMGLRLSQSYPPTVHQRDLLDAFCQQIAMALDRRRLREESQKAKVLAESERLSNTLLNSISHEIRTPLAAIKSATGNLIEFQEAAFSEPQRAMIGEIQEATERLNRLCGNVLDMTRLESGHFKPKRSPCDVRDLIQVAVRETRKQLTRHKFSIELAPDLPLVLMDFVLMQQALTNLLSNAAFHTPAGTWVKVAARVDGDAFILTVADGGPGIPDDSLDRIFDKFYRAPGARTGGTGLGLSLVKGFVEAQGGRVTAQNQPGGGALFTIRLPVKDNHSVPAAANL